MVDNNNKTHLVAWPLIQDNTGEQLPDKNSLIINVLHLQLSIASSFSCLVWQSFSTTSSSQSMLF